MRTADRTRRARNANVDERLLERRRVLQCLDAVRGPRGVGHPDMDELVRRLASLGGIVPATLLKVLETERDPAVVGLAAQTLEWMIDSGALDCAQCAQAIERLALGREVPDETRVRLLVTLDHLGVDVTNARFSAAFKNLTAIVESSREQVLSEIEADESLLCQLLEEIGRLDPDTRISMLEDYAGSHQPMALRLYEIIGRSDDPRTGRIVVEALQEKASSDAASVLAGLAQIALLPETRRRAERALKALRFSGVTPQVRCTQALGPVCISLVGAIDGGGNRMIWIGRATLQPDELAVIHVMLNDQQGIKDCVGSTHIGLADYDEQVRILNESEDIDYESFDCDYCIALLKDALAVNIREGMPVAPQFLLLMEILSDWALVPEPYSPPFEGIDMDAIRRDRNLLERTDRLIDLPELRNWVRITDPTMQDASRANRLTDREGGGHAFRSDVHEHMKRLCLKILYTEVAPRAPLLRRRLELMADYMARSGSQSIDVIHCLLSAAVNLPQSGTLQRGWPEDIVLPEEHPFLVSLAQRSLEQAQTALRLGLELIQGSEG